VVEKATRISNVDFLESVHDRREEGGKRKVNPQECGGEGIRRDVKEGWARARQRSFVVRDKANFGGWRIQKLVVRDLAANHIVPFSRMPIRGHRGRLDNFFEI
jgi:hypothetical protein